MFYIPQQQPGEEEKTSTTQLTLSPAYARDLYTLVTQVQKMAGPDAYYGYICRCCDTRFVHEGQEKHEEWCPVPAAERLMAIVLPLRDIAEDEDKLQKLLRMLP